MALVACSGSKGTTSEPPASPAPEDGDSGPGGGDGDDGGGGGGGGDGGDPGEPPPSSFVDTTTKGIDVDGAARRYVLSVPKAYDEARRYPLIVALHGDGQGAAGFAASSKLEAATRGGAFLAFPDGSVDLFTPYDDNPDQKLVARVIAEVSGAYAIDPTKIWGFGYSKGAYQLNELACKRPGLLSAMAIHAGGAPQTRDGAGNVDCPSAIGLPVFVTHGERDDPGGGRFGADYWASRAGCGATKTASTPSICEAYDGCDAGKPVAFCLVPGHPHYPLYADAAAHSWGWFTSL